MVDNGSAAYLIPSSLRQDEDLHHGRRIGTGRGVKESQNCHGLYNSKRFSNSSCSSNIYREGSRPPRPRKIETRANDEGEGSSGHGRGGDRSTARSPPSGTWSHHGDEGGVDESERIWRASLSTDNLFCRRRKSRQAYEDKISSIMNSSINSKSCEHITAASRSRPLHDGRDSPLKDGARLLRSAWCFNPPSGLTDERVASAGGRDCDPDTASQIPSNQQPEQPSSPIIPPPQLGKLPAEVLENVLLLSGPRSAGGIGNKSPAVVGALGRARQCRKKAATAASYSRFTPTLMTYPDLPCGFKDLGRRVNVPLSTV